LCSDYEFLQLPIQEQNDILKGWLLSAVSDFTNCKADLSDRNETQFNKDLSDAEKNVLAKYMLTYWLSPKLYTVENLKNYLSSKDFTLYSGANFLKEIRETHKQAVKDANAARKSYAYKNFNPMEDLL
jgi:hypothetical protein